MATARRTRVCFSSASRRPRSANTLPELSTTASLFFPFAISRLVILACCPEPSRNQVRICPSRLYALRGFLLERMQHIRSVLELYRIYRAVGVTFVILDDFKDSRAFALPRLRLWMLSPKLRHAQSDANFILHSFRKFHQVALGGSNPKQRLFARSTLWSRHPIIPVLGYYVKPFGTRLAG